MTRPSSDRLIRPLIRNLHAYTPGEQPAIKHLIKLNTNENPYPPSPKVLLALSRMLDGRLRLYPNPRAQQLRDRLAKFHGCDSGQVIVGNGSDDLLALATRAFAEPILGAANKSKSTIQYFNPSYSLYPVLANIQGSRSNAVELAEDFDLPSVAQLRKSKAWDFCAALTFITTPHAPSGRAYATRALRELCEHQKGVVILDEAYADFAKETALELALQYPHVIVSRTFSKSYSLCFLRVGYFIGSAKLIAALDTVRDSYNVNGAGQTAALAALQDQAYFKRTIRRIVATRERLAHGLTTQGFQVLPSQTNFLLVRPPGRSARVWLERLRARNILVRWWPYPKVRNYLRITIGTDDEVDALLEVIASCGSVARSRKK